MGTALEGWEGGELNAEGVMLSLILGLKFESKIPMSQLVNTKPPFNPPHS